MCGITGLYAFDHNAINRLANVQQSVDKLYKRGPDSGDFYKDSKIALGHRRLSILDISTAAAQPMYSPDGRYIIVFNGEIFNFKSLYTTYLPELHQEKNQIDSDTEVLLHLLIKYNTQCLEWLHGFFAFAFYDTESKDLIIARDPLGKKPLLYFEHEDYFAFASEIKALLEWNIPKAINYSVLFQYLQLNYVIQPHSMLEGVKKLKPGHYLKIQNNKITTYQAYYVLKTHTDQYPQYSYEEAQKTLIHKMNDAVAERMIADVPLGAFLSGGIDSSVIVALASQHTQKLHTFSIGYKNNPYFDETHYALLVAQKYKTEHQVFSLTNDDFLEHVFDVLDYIDEPFADSSAIPVFILSQKTKQYVTVALSGDGADEVFSGYNKHAAEYKMRQSSLSKSLVSLGAPLWELLPHSRNHKWTNLFRQLDRFAQGAKMAAPERYWQWASFLKEKEALSLLSTSKRDKVSMEYFQSIKNEIIQNIKSEDFNEVLLCDMQMVLLSDMLVKVDLMSMANSLEIRSPFLDKSVVDFAFGLPASYKIDGGMKKKIVQDAFRTMLPEELYKRPKHGFEIPLLDWFRNELWSLIDNDLLSDTFVIEQNIFDPSTIKLLKKKLKSNNPEDSHATIWALLVFQYWWKKYIA